MKYIKALILVLIFTGCASHKYPCTSESIKAKRAQEQAVKQQFNGL